MKKMISLVLITLMVLSLAACDKNKITSNDFSYVYSSDPQTMDYTVTYRAEDHRYNANYVDGLLENDSLGNYVPALAESYDHNEDYTEWTFNIRKGAKWVNSNGEEYAEVTAQDWVTGLRHAAEFQSSTLYLVQFMIEGLNAYVSGETTDFATVGVEAVDEYTLKYTLTDSYPYFYTIATYGILFPINQEFLESKGEGCKLGAPDLANCSFGAMDPTSILYNGGYILTNYTAKSVIELQKNQNYWDAEHVYINKLTWTFNDGQDPYSVIKGFEDGVYTQSALNASWEDYEAYKTQYADQMRAGMPDATTFNVAFNFNRVNAKNSNKKGQELVDTHAAIMNKNFRLAVMTAFDKLAYAKQGSEEEVAKLSLRNTLTAPDFLKTSDGTTYGELIQKELSAGQSFPNVNIADGENAFYDPARCLEFIAAAKADGIKFPVTLDIVCYEKSQNMINQMNSLKNSIETSSNGEILINIVMLPLEDYYYATYWAETGADSDWDISTATGWGPDYMDPISYLNIYNTFNGDMMNSIGLDATSNPNCTDSSRAAMLEVGLDEYDALLKAADAIKDDNDARYAAFAKADAWLLENAFTIPVQCTTVSMVVSKVVPFTGPYSMAGLGEYKFKFMQVQDEIVTADAYAKAKETWLKNKA